MDVREHMIVFPQYIEEVAAEECTFQWGNVS